MKLLSAAPVNFHTTNYSCTVTATLHAVRFHVWHLLMFYSMLHFVHPYISVPPAVPHPCSPYPSPHTHTSRITNGTMANSHSTALLGSAPLLCACILRFKWHLFTDVTILRLKLGVRRVLQCFSAAVLQCYGAALLQCYSAAVLQCYDAPVLQCYIPAVLQYCSSYQQFPARQLPVRPPTVTHCNTQ
jgi:hypothetical protein